MFKGCTSLASLDLSNLNTIGNDYYSNILDKCPSIKYINLLNYKGKDIFGNMEKNTN